MRHDIDLRMHPRTQFIELAVHCRILLLLRDHFLIILLTRFHKALQREHAVRCDLGDLRAEKVGLGPAREGRVRAHWRGEVTGQEALDLARHHDLFRGHVRQLRPRLARALGDEVGVLVGAHRALHQVRVDLGEVLLTRFHLGHVVVAAPGDDLAPEPHARLLGHGERLKRQVQPVVLVVSETDARPLPHGGLAVQVWEGGALGGILRRLHKHGRLRVNPLELCLFRRRNHLRSALISWRRRGLGCLGAHSGTDLLEELVGVCRALKDHLQEDLRQVVVQ
mmetsp:Transcript_15600/g.27867  ORF Transcript_15600/g.27867 Transcript_15600/m.27867 type:complete len:280 (-) Transcript_15600:79-918(-)